MRRLFANKYLKRVACISSQPPKTTGLLEYYFTQLETNIFEILFLFAKIDYVEVDTIKSIREL